MSEDERKTEERKFKWSSKLTFYLGGLGGLLAFIAVSAVWDLTFGSFDVSSFVADTLILIAISLATMVLSDLLSEETNMSKVLGMYNIAQNGYDAAYNAVAGMMVYFSQWYFWYRDRETRRKREGYLMLHGFDGISARKIVAYAELSDLEPMRECQKYYVKTLLDGRKVPFKKIATDEQAEAFQSVLQGKQDVKCTDYASYLFTEDVSEANMSVLERQAYLERRRKQSKKKAYAMRIVMLVFTSLLMAALGPDEAEEGKQANKWWTFIKRLGVFVTSFISGWLAGSTDVKAKAAKIKDKTSILVSFKDCSDKGLWKPKTQEELDREAIEEWESEQAFPSGEQTAQ